MYRPAIIVLLFQYCSKLLNFKKNVITGMHIKDKKNRLMFQS